MHIFKRLNLKSILCEAKNPISTKGNSESTDLYEIYERTLREIIKISKDVNIYVLFVEENIISEIMDNLYLSLSSLKKLENNQQIIELINVINFALNSLKNISIDEEIRK